MQINFYQKNWQLSDEQKDYITAKCEQLHKYKVMEDPSVIVRVDVEYQDHLSTDKKTFVKVTVDIPKQVLRAETECIVVEEGIDLIIPKLVQQLEKYKAVHQ